MMFLGGVCLRLQLVLPQFRFGLLVGTLDEVALALPLGPMFQRLIGRGIAQRIGVFAIRFSAQSQPLFHCFTLLHRPYSAGGKGIA